MNRLEGEMGFCRVGADVKISFAGLHHGEEPPISGSRGSGTIFFAGCNLRCVFCQNHQISQDFHQTSLRTLSIEALAGEMLRLQEMGAHNINFVSPSHMVYQMAEAIAEAKSRSLTIPVVYNSNGYDSLQALRQIRGLVDIFLPDIKYCDNELGRKYSNVDNYADHIGDVLREMLDTAGHLELDSEGVALRGVLVRHLVLPGHLENSRKALRTLAGLSPEIAVSIMSQYSPQYRAHRYPEINRPLRKDEYDAITDYALELRLENAFIQELTSQSHYLPHFEDDRPFD
ncbi:MAG: radical SAM protein [Candidatus Eisenbacteria bacterium]|uniref:Radical SAM protein n=1 Tax=Eiseniibacteriota bacterium TaxID=2212470 RepID=A0A948RXN8_UNCEI|nr:radical SAM protein [Candidatus Eisenbacteria bacterium]